jgi:hypothetical protein
MGKKDPRVDAYIEQSAVFAKPILAHIREVVHATVPEVEEAMKCHCAFGFWKGELVFDGKADRSALGHFGRITSLDDLPSDRVLAGYIRKAAVLNDKGVKVTRKPSAPRTELEVPAYFTAALRKNKKARATFENLSHSHKKEYLEWVMEAKSEATRQKRLDTAVGWMAEGKSRNWKYMP